MTHLLPRPLAPSHLVLSLVPALPLPPLWPVAWDRLAALLWLLFLACALPRSVSPQRSAGRRQREPGSGPESVSRCVYPRIEDAATEEYGSSVDPDDLSSLCSMAGEPPEGMDTMSAGELSNGINTMSAEQAAVAFADMLGYPLDQAVSLALVPSVELLSAQLQHRGGGQSAATLQAVPPCIQAAAHARLELGRGAVVQLTQALKQACKGSTCLFESLASLHTRLGELVYKPKWYMNELEAITSGLKVLESGPSQIHLAALSATIIRLPASPQSVTRTAPRLSDADAALFLPVTVAAHEAADTLLARLSKPLARMERRHGLLWLGLHCWMCNLDRPSLHADDPQWKRLQQNLRWCASHAKTDGLLDPELDRKVAGLLDAVRTVRKSLGKTGTTSPRRKRGPTPSRVSDALVRRRTAALMDAQGKAPDGFFDMPGEPAQEETNDSEQDAQEGESAGTSLQHAGSHAARRPPEDDGDDAGPGAGACAGGSGGRLPTSRANDSMSSGRGDRDADRHGGDGGGGAGGGGSAREWR